MIEQQATNLLTRNRPVIDNWYTVAKGGADFRSIQKAIDKAAPKASPTNPWGVFVYPGVYTENLVGAENVYLIGASVLNVLINGTIDFSGVNKGLDALTVQRVVQQDDGIIIKCGGVIWNCNAIIILTDNFPVLGVQFDCVSPLCGANTLGVFITDLGTTDQDIEGIKFTDAGDSLLYGSSVDIVCSTATSANHRGLIVDNTGSFAAASNRIYGKHNNPGFSGDFCFRRMTNDAYPMTSAGSFFQALGAGGGTVTAFCCDSGGKNATANEDVGSIFIDGYGEEYIESTAPGDRQIIRLVSPNKAFPSRDTGGQVAITPFDDNKSGFRNFVGTGNVYSISGTTFTVLKSGVGYIKSVPTFWDLNQSITLVANQPNFAAYNFDGAIERFASATREMYTDHIPVYACMYDGTHAVVKRESHPYDFPTPVSLWAHESFGVRIGLQGAVPTRVSTGTGGAIGDRQLKIVDQGVIDDHGISGIIPDTAGAPITMQVWYRNPSLNWIWYSASTEVPQLYLLAGVVTAIPANSWGILLLEAVLDDGNTTSPTYILRLANAIFGNSNDALAAIVTEKGTEGTYFVLPTKEYLALEPARLAYMVIRNSGGGYISSVERIKKA